ncbi:hypothetical protein V6N12_016940 [Hibiscus sabdariffa]|uniref:Uncharacterized protein n=1 Tax=Hibiscus sabdariffa TaxID=183260 RepID=A0ABR2AU79_9ROSI
MARLGVTWRLKSTAAVAWLHVKVVGGYGEFIGKEATNCNCAIPILKQLPFSSSPSLPPSMMFLKQYLFDFRHKKTSLLSST